MINNGTMYEQLKGFKPVLSQITGKNPRVRLPSPQLWKEDGVDHINISPNGATQIGRQLYTRNCINFESPVLGHFLSLNNAWFFIKANNPTDKIRTLQTNSVKLIGYLKANGGMIDTVKNFRTLFMHIAYTSVLCNELTMKLIIESDLPFDTYQIFQPGNIRRSLGYSSWFADGFEEIRSALKERREPDFFKLYGQVKNLTSLYAEIIRRCTGSKDTVEIDISQWEQWRWSIFDQYMASSMLVKPIPSDPVEEVVDIDGVTDAVVQNLEEVEVDTEV